MTRPDHPAANAPGHTALPPLGAERLAPSRTPEIDPSRLIFVGGLHRSGTTLLASLLGLHPQVSGLSGTGVHEDEGQHLQRVYPPAAAFGGPGRFAFSEEAHLTESSPLVSANNRAALLEAWSPYWDTARPFLVEKSPTNLIRFRFLQALFPGAVFVAVVRHPIPVTYATRRFYGRWHPWRRPTIGAVLRHWATAHEIFEGDERHLERVVRVRYEELTADPARVLRHVGDRVGLSGSFPESSVTGVEKDRSERYFVSWRRDLGRPILGIARRRAARAVEPGVARWDYSLLD